MASGVGSNCVDLSTLVNHLSDGSDNVREIIETQSCERVCVLFEEIIGTVSSFEAPQREQFHQIGVLLINKLDGESYFNFSNNICKCVNNIYKKCLKIGLENNPLFPNAIPLVDHLLKSDLSRIPLFHWIRHGQKENVENFLKLGGSLKQTDSKGRTSLHHALFKKKYEICKLLVEHGVEVNQGDIEGVSPLHEAACRGNREIVEFLLDHGAIPEARDGWGRTPLYQAVLKEHKEVVEFLLERGADVNQVAYVGISSLYVAVCKQNQEIVKRLLKAGADVNQSTHQDGETPLHVAAGSENKEILELLLRDPFELP